MPAHHLHRERRVLDGWCKRADLIERGAKGDKAVARDAAVGWFEADDAAKGCRLTDRASRIASGRKESEPGGYRCRGSSRGASRNAFEIPRILYRIKGGVFIRRPHGELVEVGFADEERVLFFQKTHGRCAERGAVIFQELGGAGGQLSLDVHIVFDC